MSKQEENAKMAELICEFVMEKETKGAVRYQQVRNGKPWSIDQGATIGTVYIRKSAFVDQKPPAAITVIVEEQS